MLFSCDATVQFCSLESPSVNRYTYESSMGLQMFSPYGAGTLIVVRETLFVVRECHSAKHRVTLCDSVIQVVARFMKRLS